MKSQKGPSYFSMRGLDLPGFLLRTKETVLAVMRILPAVRWTCEIPIRRFAYSAGRFL